MGTIFPGTVKAQKAVWLVGDAFLCEVILTFQAMKTKALQKHKPWPYLYANYNLETLTAPIRSNIRPLPAHVHNAFVNGMNDEDLNFHLPRYVIIILDKDILDYTKSDMSLVEDALKWLLININMDIETRKEDLRKNRPGALSSTTEPRLIWLQMVRRPGDPTDIDQFNSILEDTIVGDECSHIMKIHLNTDTSNFDRMDQITHDGKVQYWRLIDDTMKEFDTGKVELVPHKQALKQQEQFLNQYRPAENQNRNRNQHKVYSDDGRSNRYLDTHHNNQSHWG